MTQKIYPQKPVKLMVGMLSQDEQMFDLAEQLMADLWGAIDISSDVMPFIYTRYYNRAMGEGLLRKFVAFEKLILPEDISNIKHRSNQLELDLQESPLAKQMDVKRAVNLDPGYINSSKLVLVTTKDYSHRVFIGNDMYAEATLHYCYEKWNSWPYTYPDYGSGDYDPFLNAARDSYIGATKDMPDVW